MATHGRTGADLAEYRARRLHRQTKRGVGAKSRERRAEKRAKKVQS